MSIVLSLHTLWLYIGIQVNLNEISGNVIGIAVAIIGIALLFRIVITYSIMYIWEPKLNMHERFFVSLAWLPKATVQAALG